MSHAETHAPAEVKGHWLLGIAPRMAADPLGLLLEMGQRGDVVQMRLGPLQIYLLARPELIKRVLQDNYRNYTKHTRPYLATSELIGHGLVTSEGEYWLRQRRIAQPAFHRQRIAGFATSMVAQAEAMLARWSVRGPGSTALDAAEEMTRLTQAVVGDTLLGADVGPDAGEAHRAFTQLSAGLIERIRKPYLLPLWLPLRVHRELRGAVATLERVVDRIIARRRAETTPGNDLLSMLLHARDEETGQGMTDLQLRAEALTMYFAGHETTATTLAWAWYLLSQHPDVEAKLHAEVDRVLGGRAPTLADVDSLPLTRQIVDETLRLYPAVWAVSRHVHADDVVDGYLLKKGSLVFVSPWVLHRLPSLWDEPDAFRPDRFTPESNAARHRFAYFPFLGGPRQCIGNAFALMEATLVLATVASRYRLRLAPGAKVVPDPLLTLRIKGGLPMFAEPRQPVRASA